MRLLTLLFLFSSPLVFAQRNCVSLSKSVDDDGKMLHISVNGNINGKPLNYHKSFSVSGLSKIEKEALKEKVWTSLGLSTVNPPEVPQPPAPPTMAVSSVRSGVNEAVTRNGLSRSSASAARNSFSKEVSFDPENGLLVMKYRFKRNGVEHIAERTVDVDIETAAKREKAVQDFEEELELQDTREM